MIRLRVGRWADGHHPRDYLVNPDHIVSVELWPDAAHPDGPRVAGLPALLVEDPASITRLLDLEQ